ncbi:MAG TPA: baseplate J/gp47 family protein, partial [Longimicrobium sp.]
EGARFLVGCSEALGKALGELTLTLRWKDAPRSFAALYEGYGQGGGLRLRVGRGRGRPVPRAHGVDNGSFTAAARFVDGAVREVTAAAVPLFDGDDARAAHEITFRPGEAARAWSLNPGGQIRALREAGAEWSVSQATRLGRARPVHAASAAAHGQVVAFDSPSSPSSPAGAVPEATPGFVTLMLNRDFLHAEYRRQYVSAVITANGKAPDLPAEPYTPAVQSISLSYTAHSRTVPVSSTSLDDFSDPDVQFFQLGPFGPRREHGYQHQQLGLAAAVDLLPALQHRGELLIGLSSLSAGDSVSLLFQAAEGSADPSLPREPVSWAVLCDNHWKPLESRDLVLDTTNGLLASGIVRVLVPAEATVANTFLPAGLLWLKASVASHVDAVSQLVEVAANAVEVEFQDPGAGPAHLGSALAARSITRVKSAPAALKSVAQPYASFGARAPEGDTAFRTRAAERLRHRGRCVTAWDYERAVLEAFPGIHRAKCVPHSRQGAWMAPGNVLMVVVPDLRNRNAVDPLRPRADADTLARIAAHLQARAGMGVRISVANPRYQPVRLHFAVRFRDGVEFNQGRQRLNGDLVRALCPWAFDDRHDVAFGGAVYRSVLLNFVEERPYVDYVTDFRLHTTPPGAAEREVREARAAAPDAILVSAPDHAISAA